MNAIAQTHSRSMSGSKLDNRRMLAALIDLAVVGAGAAAVLATAGVLGGDGASMGAPLAGVVLCWALYYYFACESGGGQTLGKRLMRLRVVRVDGSPAGMQEIAVRTVLRVADTALVGLVAMLATGERRARLGDLAAGTMIVSTDAAPAVATAAA
ncbi:MAG: RDD family protein, partial [Thermoleophilaceae bacterium]